MQMSKNPTSDKILLPNVRLSFARLYTPKAFQPGQDPRFEATFLLDPSNPGHATVIAKIKDTARQLAEQGMQGKPVPWDDVKLPFGSGDKKSYDGYKGMWFIASHNKIRPQVLNRSGTPVTEGDAEAPYSGCYVHGSIALWFQNNQYGKRINVNLRAVRFVKDGQAFGAGQVDAETEFEGLEDAPGGAAGGKDPFAD